MTSDNNVATIWEFRIAFQSLDEMRDAHRSLRRFSKAPENDPAAILKEIHAFLARGVLLGEQLDLAADRDHAQGMLDYWASLRETEYRSTDDAQRLSSVQDAVLLPFNRAAANALVEKAEQVLKQLSEEDRDLVCRILVRMIHLDPTSRTFTVGKESVAALRKMGEPAKVDSLLTSLETAGVLMRVTGESGEQMTLSHESLMRSWAPLAEALAQRLRFREAAEFWEAHDRDPVALLSSGPLLDEAVGYRDMGDLEREFADASRNKHQKAQKNKVLFLSSLAFVLFVGVILLSVSSYIAYTRNDQLADANRSLNKKHEQSVVVQIARSLAEIVVSDNRAERALDRKRLGLLVDKNPEISRIASEEFSAALEMLDEGAVSPSDRTALQRQILNYGRRLQAEALRSAAGGGVDTAVLTAVEIERSIAFEMVRYCTEQIVTNFEQNTPFHESDPFVVEFWKLYWADLAFVEEEGVEEAMVAFGKKLNEIDRKKLTEISPELLNLVSAGIKTFGTSKGDEEGQLTVRQQVQSLVESDLNELPDELKRSVENWDKWKVDKNDTAELRKRLNDLHVALDRELKQPVQFEKPLSEL